MKKLFFLAAAITVMASCADEKFLGEDPGTLSENGTEEGAILFGLSMQKQTRADIGGPAAADLLGNHFYVTGTKGTEDTYNPTENIVFDNYLVHYGVNTAGTTTSNTANWEYVGVTPGSGSYTNYVKLSSLNSQTIKYWDYSTEQYDFMGFSTGKDMKAVAYSSINYNDIKNDEIGVEKMKYGEALNVQLSTPVAYKFFIPTVAALQKAYITDITEVKKTNYGKEVQLQFKNLGSKVRVALYETVPGYSIKDVIFYTVDGTTDFTDASKSGTAKLISANASGIPTNATIEVLFPHVGTNYEPGGTAPKQDYNKAIATVTSPGTGAAYATKLDFGALTDQLVGKDPSGYEANDNVYLGRSLPEATFAGDEDADFYQTVFPVSSSDPLTLRVDYKLVATDGSGEVINVKGAKAVVPATYTTWLPNYAYTYIFKISDNTNGWTGTASEPAGLFPITFDAVVAEATDANAEQKTITTVATPTITTYQQGHDLTKNEYSKATGKNVYVQVMDNTTTTPTLKNDLDKNTPESKPKSLLYAVDAEHAATVTEAQVMDVLQKRKAAYAGDAATVIGRNGITLTKSDKINNAVTSIENGVDNNPIIVSAGEAAMITITGDGSLSAGTYAYVYDYTSASRIAGEVQEYQPITVTTSSAIGTSGVKYASITTTDLATLAETASNFTVDDPSDPDDQKVDNDYIYFSVTTNGGSTKTYSYISVAGKTDLPAGLLKVSKSSLPVNVDGTTTAVEGTFYFDIYYVNNGKYAVKVIKIVA
ncbi:MAG: hypothetical protein E7105_05675 [Prevotella sp.]|nr:hypothetical protein [Prevotella sp.]